MKEVVSVSCYSITSIFPTHTKCNALQGQKYLWQQDLLVVTPLFFL